jgi:competence protein ComEC
VMAIGRFAPRPVRWGLALGAMALFLLLAGPQPSVGGGLTTAPL